MSFKNKIQNWFYLDDEELQEQEAQQKRQQQQSKQQKQAVPEPKRPKKEPVKAKRPQPKKNEPVAVNEPRLVGLPNSQKASKIMLLEPRVYEEVEDMAEHLKSRRTILVNLQKLDHEQSRRVIDYLSGVIDAIGGEMARVGNGVFICAPEQVEVVGEITDY